jgi:hypothetical protein
MLNTYWRSLPLLALAVFFTMPGNAHAFGDPPDFATSIGPASAPGCFARNWQQHSWYDTCPVYVHPKAYMYRPPLHGVALRVRG